MLLHREFSAVPVYQVAMQNHRNFGAFRPVQLGNALDWSNEDCGGDYTKRKRANNIKSFKSAFLKLAKVCVK